MLLAHQAARLRCAYFSSLLGLHTGADGQIWMFGYNGQRIGVQANKRRAFATTNNKDTEAIDSGAQRLLSR